MAKLEQFLIAASYEQGNPQRRPFLKRKRAGQELTREQVKAIKAGRKLLRKELKAKGIKDKSDFELTATNMGLYYDKHRFHLWLLWLFHGCGMRALLLALLLLLLTLFAYSTITQLQGHFTINMSDGMFREGFVLSETRDFENPTTHLFATPAEAVPCISIVNLPDTLDSIDGPHNATYFAYTFYCRNEGESTVGYSWQIGLNSESRALSSATWVMIFEDGEMLFYADRNTETGEAEALPAMDDDSRGYIVRPLEQFNKSPETQYQIIQEGRGYDYNRVIPVPFVTDTVVAMGKQEGVKPGEIHKYTVVMWLEGDDPECVDDVIGGHLGLEVHMELLGESATESDKKGVVESWREFWRNFWNKTPGD